MASRSSTVWSTLPKYLKKITAEYGSEFPASLRTAEKIVSRLSTRFLIPTDVLENLDEHNLEFLEFFLDKYVSHMVPSGYNKESESTQFKILTELMVEVATEIVMRRVQGLEVTLSLAAQTIEFADDRYGSDSGSSSRSDSDGEEGTQYTNPTTAGEDSRFVGEETGAEAISLQELSISGASASLSASVAYQQSLAEEISRMEQSLAAKKKLHASLTKSSASRRSQASESGASIRESKDLPD